MRKCIKIYFVLFTVLALFLVMMPQNQVKAEDTSNNIEQAIKRTVDLYRSMGAPDDEWVVFALNAVGEDLNKIPYKSDNGQTFIDNFALSENPDIATCSKAIIALVSIGQDVKNFNGRNLINELRSHDISEIQYINTATFALIALDAAGSETADTNIDRNALINYLLDNQIENVWGYSWDGVDYTDVDTTAQAIIALAPYYNDVDRPEVKDKIDTAVDWLKTQLPYTSSESYSQVIQALTALGIDPQTWADGRNIVEEFLAYQMDDGSFKHSSADEQGDLNFATPQGLQALAALKDFEQNGISTIYQNVQYNEKNVVTLRIEGSQTDGTILEKTFMDVPQDSALSEIVQLAVDRYQLSNFISVDGDNIIPGNGLTVPEGNQFYCVVDDKYVTGNPVIADGADIVLFLGDVNTRLARLNITGNSIDNTNNVVSTNDDVYIRVEELSTSNEWVASVGAAVYLDGKFAGLTNDNGEIAVNPDKTGNLEIHAQKFKDDGTAQIVKTLPENIIVRQPVHVSVRIEGIINETYYPDGTILPETTVEVPDGCKTNFAIKKALDESGIGNTIDINGFMNIGDIILKGNIQETLSDLYYMFQVNDDLDTKYNVTDGDSIVLYMSQWPTTSYAKVTANKYQASVGEEIVISVLKSDGGWPASYIPAGAGIEIYEAVEGGDDILWGITDENGELIITFNSPGRHEIYAQKFNEEGIPEIVKTSTITIINDTKIEQLNPVASFSLGSDVDVTVKITNYLEDQDKEGLLIVALYDTENNKMVNYSYVTKTIAPNSSETFTAGFAIPESGSYEVRAFMWDNWDNRTPLTDTIVIPVVAD